MRVQLPKKVHNSLVSGLIQIIQHAEASQNVQIRPSWRGRRRGRGRVLRPQSSLRGLRGVGGGCGGRGRSGGGGGRGRGSEGGEAEEEAGDVGGHGDCDEQGGVVVVESNEVVGKGIVDCPTGSHLHDGLILQFRVGLEDIGGSSGELAVQGERGVGGCEEGEVAGEGDLGAGELYKQHKQGQWPFHCGLTTIQTLDQFITFQYQSNKGVGCSWYCIYCIAIIQQLQLPMDWVNPLAKVNNKFKFQLFGRQFENLLQLYLQVPKFDPSSTGCLSEHAFNLLLNAAGVFLTTQQIRTIRDAFPSGTAIAYRQFVDNVRNDMTPKRYAAIDHTFEQFQEGGAVGIAALVGSLRAERHPHVRSLSKKAEKCQKDVEEGLRYWSNDGLHLTHQEFTEYFKDVNACVPLEREEFYVDLLIHSFGLFEGGVTHERLLQLEVTVFERVRQRTQQKKDEGLRSTLAFQFLDLEEKGLIDFQRFVGVLERVGCRFSDRECKALFYKHSQGGNLLGYESLCGLLFQMGSGVKENANPVFELARSGEGAITTAGMTKRLT